MMRTWSIAAAMALVAAPAFAAKLPAGAQSSQTAGHTLPPGTTIAAKPDLTSDLGGIFSPGGVVKIYNGGAGPAGASVATLGCAKVAGPHGQGLTAPQRCLLMKSQWANGVLFGTTGNVIKLHVPALAAGAEFTYTLPFWHETGWSPGRYEIVLSADVDATVAESNETNNVASVTKTVP